MLGLVGHGGEFGFGNLLPCSLNIPGSSTPVRCSGYTSGCFQSI